MLGGVLKGYTNGKVTIWSNWGTSTSLTCIPTTSVSAQVSSAKKKKELVQLVEKCQGSKRFLELQWIH